MKPAHIIDDPGARITRCGRPLFDKKDSTGYPVVYAPFVQRHIDGWGMEVCGECATGGWPTPSPGCAVRGAPPTS